MKKIIEYFVNQGAFVNLITVFVTVLGIYSVVKIQREVFPNISFDVITVTTRYPGASAESSERLITNPLEQDLREIDGIKKMTSISAESTSVIVLQLDPDQVDSDEAEADIQDVVDAFTELPSDAEDPIVVVVESKLRPTVTVSLSGDVSETLLRQTAKSLEREIERLRPVAKINYDGKRDFEIRIKAQPEKLKKFRISLSDLINSLRRQNLNIPGGTMEAFGEDSKEVIIRTMGEFANEEDVGNTVIRANALAKAIRVKDVADIEMSFAKRKLGYRTNNSSSINLTVLKKDGADAIQMVDLVKDKVNSLKDKFAPGVKVDFINDQSYFVRRRLKVLTNNLLVGLGLVLIILSLILPWRVAAVTAFGIPFSFLGALSLFFYGNVSLNLISMMGLIIVVGMLVDDAVVITENIQSEMEGGKSPTNAAIDGTTGIWAPVTASVMTTVFAFAPMLFMSGIMGKFIQFIPLGVILALSVSLFECFFILPHHMASWIKVSVGGNVRGGLFAKVWESTALPAYEALLKMALKFRYVVALLVIGMFAGSIFLVVKKMDFILFPPGAIDTFMVKVEAPIGIPLDKMEKLLQPIEKEIANLPIHELQDFTTQVGLIGDGGANNSKRGGNYAMITVFLTAETERSRKAFDVIEELREKLGTPPGISKISFQRQQGGPPVGKPVSIGVRSDEYQHINPVIALIKEKLKEFDGVSDIADTFIVGKDEIHVHVKDNEASAANLSMAEIGTTVRAAYEGVVATSIRTLDEEIDVRVTLADKYRGSRDTLNNLQITNQRGNLIPLPRVATLKPAKGIATYEHEDNQRQVTVNAEIDTKITTSSAVNGKMKKWIEELKPQYPKVSFSFGGEEADTKESMQSLIESFALAFFGIFMLLILLFKNIYQPIIIASTIPLGVMSVIWAFYMHQMPLTFLAMVGIIALAGVIVNNAIVMIDFVNKARSAGEESIQSIVTGATKRLRPIFLTTLTTTVGILPTAYGVGGLDPFVVPIALALGWGILFGSILTTIILPPVIAIMDDLMNAFRAIGRNVFRVGS